jgi:hypothetical protein
MALTIRGESTRGGREENIKTQSNPGAVNWAVSHSTRFFGLMEGYEQCGLVSLAG